MLNEWCYTNLCFVCEITINPRTCRVRCSVPGSFLFARVFSGHLHLQPQLTFTLNSCYFGKYLFILTSVVFSGSDWKVISLRFFMFIWECVFAVQTAVWKQSLGRKVKLSLWQRHLLSGHINVTSLRLWTCRLVDLCVVAVMTFRAYISTSQQCLKDSLVILWNETNGDLCCFCNSTRG